MLVPGIPVTRGHVSHRREANDRRTHAQMPRMRMSELHARSGRPARQRPCATRPCDATSRAVIETGPRRRQVSLLHAKNTPSIEDGLGEAGTPVQKGHRK
jgi:hypothetical protein